MKPMNIHQAMKKYRWQYAIFPVLMFIHIILLASCAPAQAKSSGGCFATPEMAPDIFRRYGFDVAYVETISGEKAQAFMTRFRAGEVLQALTHAVTFWRVVAVNRADSDVAVGDVLVTHISGSGCLIKFISAFPAHALRGVVGTPL